MNLFIHIHIRTQGILEEKLVMEEKLEQKYEDLYQLPLQQG